jgi:hypothetical protein
MSDDIKVISYMIKCTESLNMMVTGSFKEACEKTIDFSRYVRTAILCFVSYFYTGDLYTPTDKESISICFELLELAYLYVDSDYASNIQRDISRKINSDTCVDILYHVNKQNVFVKRNFIIPIIGDIKRYLHDNHDVMISEYLKISDLASKNNDEKMQELNAKTDLMRDMLRSYSKKDPLF